MKHSLPRVGDALSESGTEKRLPAENGSHRRCIIQIIQKFDNTPQHVPGMTTEGHVDRSPRSSSPLEAHEKPGSTGVE